MFYTNEMIFNYILEILITFSIFIFKSIINGNFNYDFNLKKVIRILIIFILKKELNKYLIAILYLEFEKIMIINENDYYKVLSSLIEMDLYRSSNK